MIQNLTKKQKIFNFLIFLICVLFSFLGRIVPTENLFYKESIKPLKTKSLEKDKPYIQSFSNLTILDTGIFNTDISLFDLQTLFNPLYFFDNKNIRDLPTTKNSNSISLPLNKTNSSTYTKKTTDILALFNTSIPVISGLCTIQPISMITMQETSPLRQKTKENRIGGKLSFTPNNYHINTFELGYLLNMNFDSYQVYAGLKGNLFADYSVCSSIKFSDDPTDTFNSWNISNSLETHTIKQFNNEKQYSFTFKTEEIWYPYKQELYFCSDINVGLSNTINAKLTYFLNSDTNYLQGTLSAAIIKDLKLTIDTCIPFTDYNITTKISGRYTF